MHLDQPGVRGMAMVACSLVIVEDLIPDDIINNTDPKRNPASNHIVLRRSCKSTLLLDTSRPGVHSPMCIELVSCFRARSCRMPHRGLDHDE